MTMRIKLSRLFSSDLLNFVITNYIPRKSLTRWVGWLSKREQPLVRSLSIAVWRLFSDLDLQEAKKTEFRSLHDCFIRELKPGARPVDPDPGILVSPCDAIVGDCGLIEGNMLIQAKRHRYALSELLCDPELADYYRHGCYATLRITASMYHRFHAPVDGAAKQVTYIGGDVWNVNPATIRRIPKLYCRNERAVLRLSAAQSGRVITLVPVAAVLVASIRLHFLDVLFHLRYPGPNRFDCDVELSKGQEMGWFQHGSTIIVFAPRGFLLHENVGTGQLIRVGQPLMRSP
jgi:phosphatidylserine decarboxylase